MTELESKPNLLDSKACSVTLTAVILRTIANIDWVLTMCQALYRALYRCYLIQSSRLLFRVGILPPLYRWGNWVFKRWKDLSKVTELESSRAGLQTSGSSMPLTMLPLTMLSLTMPLNLLSLLSCHSQTAWACSRHHPNAPFKHGSG